MSIWERLKEMIKKMIPTKTIESTLRVVPAVSNRMVDAIQLWSDMYEGKSPWLREPTWEDPTRIVSLGLPQLIASEKARMVTLEMETEITAPTKEVESPNPDYEPSSVGSDGNVTMGRGTETTKEDVPDGPTERADFLNEQYKKLQRQLRRQLEYGIAKGGLVIKPYIVLYDEQTSTANTDDSQKRKNSQNTDDKNSQTVKTSSNKLMYDNDLPGAEIEFDFIQADRFFPLSFDANGKVIEAAFIQTKSAVDKVHIRLEYHKLEGRTVTVQNLAFESDDTSLLNNNNIRTATDLGRQIPLTSVPEWASLQPKTIIEGVDRLLFAYFRMPEANTVDPYSPLGVSGYSRVVNLIKDADMQYSRLLWEYEAGEMAIDVDREAMRFTEEPDGRAFSVLPQKQQRLFRKVDLNNEETYNVFAPALRDDSIVFGLNTIFMRIEDACGLSRGTISDVNTQEAKTATELKILKQRSFASNADIQMALQDALDDTVYVMDVYCSLYEVTPDGDYEVSYEWDDSIIVDSESELSKRITLMQNGLCSKKEVRMWYFGETANQAQAALAEITDESRQAQEENFKMQAKMTEITGGNDDEGQNVKSAGDTTSAKKSKGKQADSLDNPDKSKTADSIKI